MKYNIIFLDMDGVINSWNFARENVKKDDKGKLDEEDLKRFKKEYCKFGKYYVVPELQEKVNKMLSEIKNCKVVWSSSWRNVRGYSKLFAEGLYYEVGMLKDSFLDITPTIHWQLRSDEIMYWIDHHVDEIEKAVVIDDRDDAWSLCPNEYNDIKVRFIQTDINSGITDQNIQDIYNFFK